MSINLIMIISFGYILPAVILSFLLKKCNELYILKAKSIGLREIDVENTMFGKIDKHIIYLPIVNIIKIILLPSNYKYYASIDILIEHKRRILKNRLEYLKKYTNDKDFNKQLNFLIEDNTYDYSGVILEAFYSLTDLILKYENNRHKVDYKKNKKAILDELHISVNKFKELCDELVSIPEFISTDIIGFSKYSNFLEEVLKDIREKKSIFAN